MIEAQELTGYISSVATLTGEYNKSVEYLNPPTQTKEVTPTKETIIVLPDKDYYALTKVIVKPYVPNVGTKTIVLNGTYYSKDDNLDGYNEVVVDVEPDIRQYMIESDIQYKYGSKPEFEIKEEYYLPSEVEKVRKLVEILGGD